MEVGGTDPGYLAGVHTELPQMFAGVTRVPQGLSGGVADAYRDRSRV